MGRRKRPSLPTEWRIVSRAPDGTIKREPLRAPTVPELTELSVAVYCNRELGPLLGESLFRILMLLLSWQHHQLLSLAPEGLRPPTIFELAELRVAILCKHVCEGGALLGESQFRTLMRLIDWQHHQLSPPQPLDQELIDAARWAAFRNGVKEKGWGDAGYDAARYATQQLKDSPFAAGPDQMRKSYNKMQRRLRPCSGTRFHLG
jgi:hypothetical protein